MLDVANIKFSMLQMLEFRCYMHMMLVLCREGGGEGLLMLDVARNMGRNTAAI
jgi:hypothetical protein